MCLKISKNYVPILVLIDCNLYRPDSYVYRKLFRVSREDWYIYEELRSDRGLLYSVRVRNEYELEVSLLSLIGPHFIT